MKDKLYGLDLFSGIGGNTLALREWVKTVAYCEANRHAQSVLLSRMGDGSIESAPIWDDITTLKGSMFDVPIDIIIAGFPCQDISLAGKGAGLEGKRSGLFFEVMRLAREVKPTFLFLENVPAIRTRGLDTVIEELTEAGYDSRWCMLSAANIGANHKRERWFLLAHSNQQNDKPQSRGLGKTPSSPEQQVRGNGFIGSGPRNSRQWWTVEPSVDRVVNGLPFRMDRIERLGNAVVPAQAKEAFEILIGIKKSWNS